MKDTTKTAGFRPDRRGVYFETDGICFCTDQVDGNAGGVIIYDEKDNYIRFPFTAKGRRGCLYGLKVFFPLVFARGENKAAGDRPRVYGDKEALAGCCRYNYYCGDEIIVDRDAQLIGGSGQWGRPDAPRSGGFYTGDFDWAEDSPPEVPYADSVIYGCQVRSFTMHKSSGVKHRGTFEGLSQKIPYLKALGVTALELLPAYEFDECEKMSLSGSMAAPQTVLNCWGFKAGYYYAPKAAYSAGPQADRTFKTMVRELHRAGIEVLMYFYFPLSVDRSEITAILKYWVLEYHIDGIHLLGEELPLTLITHDALLSGVKILYNEYSYGEGAPRYLNTGIYREHFRTRTRRFLKSDEDMVSAMLYHQRNNPAGRGTVNFLADYGGFSLFDLAAYDKKHNEDNGEDNRDGTDYNYSWNCGIEGPSRKKNVRELRLRQIKNALVLLLLAQGTPFIYSGDEFGNTRFGNNNAYCQDNEIGWVKWPTTVMGKEIQDFTRFLLQLRKEHPILHLPTEMQVLDYAHCGVQDMSYHGEEAWRPDTGPYSRTVGIMYCGRYVRRPDGTEDDYFYLAINMHWLPHRLALPKLPRGMGWETVAATEPDRPGPELADNDLSILVKERSICILKSGKV